MGEAKRRGAKPPTTPQRVSRWAHRLWLVYPRPVRSYFKFNAQLTFGLVLILGALLVVALVLSALGHR